MFDSIVHEDRSVLDFLNADYTFVDERLARHYGIRERLRQPLPPRDARAGPRSATRSARQGGADERDVAGDAHVAGDPRQVVPADVPRREPAGPAAERAAGEAAGERQHRQRQGADDARTHGEHNTSPACASCHQLFEPIGLALENFDGVGAWRLKDEGQPIDTTGVLVNGTKIDGVVSLQSVLMQNSEQFVRVMSEKLLTYALGRGVEHDDMPLVRSIVRDASASDYRFSTLVLGVVKSRPSRTTSRALT